MREGLYTTALLFSLLSVSSTVQAGGQIASNRFVLPDLACLFLGQCDEGKKISAERGSATGGKIPPKGLTAITTQRGGGSLTLSQDVKFERRTNGSGRIPPKT